ncbi:MAG TPA: tetratricopeptide repeat protein [Thermoanaerobaculia bacterium]|nr:tetratricopeptide repeat protein [Thermoanaerobaculia bacterium]
MTPPRRCAMIAGLILTIAITAAGQTAATPAGRMADLEREIASGTASIEEQLELARIYLKAGRYYEAGQLADRALATRPNDAEATRIRTAASEGLTSIQSTRVAEAEAAAQAPGATVEDRRALADAYFSAGRYLSAARAYGELPNDSRSREVKLRQARSLSWGGRMWEAERVYADLLREESTLELELEYGRLLSWMGASSPARQRLSEVHEASSSDDTAVALANSMAWSGRRQEAIEFLEAHLRQNADSPRATVLLAELRESLDLRLERVERMIAVEPFNLALQVERARLLYDAGRYGAALRAINEIEERRPSGQQIEGLAELKQQAEAARAQELALLQERRAALAGAEASSAEEALELAKAYVGVGAHDEAIRMYEQYLAAVPDDDEARLAYARVLTWDQRYDAAGREYRRLLQSQPDRADIRLEYAKSLSWNARYAPAVSTLSELTDLSDNPRAYLYPEVPQEAHFHLGQIYRWFGWHDHAAEHQNYALGLDATYDAARRELDMVRGLRPATRFDGRYTQMENSNDFQARMFDLRAQHWLSRRTAVDGWLGRHSFDQPDGSVEANVVGVGGRYRFDDRSLAFARVGFNNYSDGIGTRPFWTIGGEHLPSLQSRVAAEYARYDLIYDVFTLQSLEQPSSATDPIYIDDFRVHWDHDTGGRWIFLADSSYGLVSDDNNRFAAHGLATFRLWSDPFVAIKANGRFLSYDFRSNRYWSPDDYRSLAGVLQIGDNYRERFFWQIEGKYGRSWEGGRDRDLRSIGAKITVPLSDAIDLVGSYVEGESGDFERILPGDDLATYWQRTFYIGLSVKRLFQRDERGARSPYYWDDRPLEGSPVIPPLGERR